MSAAPPAIWTLTANPALDITYRVPEIHLTHTHRVTDVTARPGGKGVNVARVLAQLDIPSTVTGIIGGTPGAQLRIMLSTLDVAPLIRDRFVMTTTPTRMSIAVVDDEGEATVFNEAGEDPSDATWCALTDVITEGVRAGDILAICGSMPGSADPSRIANLVEAGHTAGAVVLVDATGDALIEACRAGADLVKPNHLELAATTGTTDVRAGAAILLERGVGSVIVSEGCEGMSVYTECGSWRARPAQRVQGNPTGAGDASVAGWCAHLARIGVTDVHECDTDFWITGLPQAVALSGAAVARPVAGEVDVELFHHMVGRIEVEGL